MEGDSVTTLLMVFTDGRDDLLDQTINSAHEMLIGISSCRKVIHTDNGHLHRKLLETRYPDFEVIGGPRKGFGGAINRAWSFASTLPSTEWLFHLEDDFLFNRPVALDNMIEAMKLAPHLAQMALVRQPWNSTEQEAGGLIASMNDQYITVDSSYGSWIEHRLWYTTNPSLIPMSHVRKGWPVVERSEGVHSIELFKDPEAACGYWGSPRSGEWVTHIGDVRVGTNY